MFRFVIALAVLALALKSEARELTGRLTFSDDQQIPLRIHSTQGGVWQIASPFFHGNADVPQSIIRKMHFDGVQHTATDGLFRCDLRDGEVFVGRLLSLDRQFCSIRHHDLGVIKIDSQQLVGLTQITKNQKVLSAADLPTDNNQLSTSDSGTMLLGQHGRLKISVDPDHGQTVSAMFQIQKDTNFRVLLKVQKKTQVTLHISADGVMAESAGSIDFADIEMQPGIERLSLTVHKQSLSVRNQLGVEVLNLPCQCETDASVEIVCDSKQLEIFQARIDTAYESVKVNKQQTASILISDKAGKSYACDQLDVKGEEIVFSENTIAIDQLQSIHLQKRSSTEARVPVAFVLWADGSRIAISRFDVRNSKLFLTCAQAVDGQSAEVSSPEVAFFSDTKFKPPTKGNHKLQVGDAQFSGKLEWGNMKQPLRWRFDGFKNSVALMMNRKIAVSEFGSRRSINLTGWDRLILANGTILPCKILSIDEVQVNFQSKYCDVQQIPMEQLQACFFASGLDSKNAKTVTSESIQRMLTIPRFSRDLEPEHVLISATGDLLRGTLISMSEKHVLFDSRAQQLRIDRKRISAIARLNSNQDAAKENLAANSANSIAINLGNNFVAIGQLEKSEGDLQVDVPGIGVLNLPQQQVKSAQVNANQINLSSLYRFTNLNPVASIDPRWTKPTVETIDAEQTQGKPAPDFELMTLDGKPFRLSDHRGKVIVLNFWATWCKPCVMGMPEYIKVIEQFAEGEVVFAAVNVNETGSTVKKFQKDAQWDTHLLLDTQSDVATQYSAQAIPHMVVINPEGTIAEVNIGYHPDAAAKLGDHIRQILKAQADAISPE